MHVIALRRFTAFPVAAVMLLDCALLSADPDYGKDIRPLLMDRCVTCHGPVKHESGLRLDAGKLILRGGEQPVIVPGRSRESLLIERVMSADEHERMPPEGQPLSPEQIELLRAWIDAGAKFPAAETIASTPEEHWAFQLIVAPSIPVVRDSNWVRNPVDAFVLARLEQHNVMPTLRAESRALLRRLHLDVTGLPPTLADQAAFHIDNYDATVVELVNRPEYGERWARHWLDTVRYADSNGYERDAEKPFVWRYRDYVIESLNTDKPFDQFLIEQLAGDELPDTSAEKMIATTYLRLGHWDDEPADPAADRYDQLDDIVSTTGQAFLGLTIGCARCHDHKFEPLTSIDYYSFMSVFSGLDRPQSGRTENAVPVGTRKQLAILARRDKQIAALEEQKKQDAEPAEEIDAQIAALKSETPDLPLAYLWHEPRPEPPEAFVLLRGTPGRHGDKVVPAVPVVLVREQPQFPPTGNGTSGRRLGLASWIASQDNPLTARIIVNRVWQQHFGVGFVSTPNDFGVMGAPPADPELLDWLAHWFMHDADWSLKKLHTLILTSNTWQQARVGEQTEAGLETARLRWVTLRRLEAEAIRDSILAVSGRLNPKRFGPAMKPPVPLAALEANADKQKVWTASDEEEASRRTIYAYIKRGLVLPMLETLDLPDTVSSCPQRQITTVAPQALSLFNGDFVNQQAKYFAARLERETGDDRDEQIRLAWKLALTREPSETELAQAREFVDRESLEQLCRVIFNLNEFVYPE